MYDGARTRIHMHKGRNFQPVKVVSGMSVEQIFLDEKRVESAYESFVVSDSFQAGDLFNRFYFVSYLSFIRSRCTPLRFYLNILTE